MLKEYTIDKMVNEFLKNDKTKIHMVSKEERMNAMIVVQVFKN